MKCIFFWLKNNFLNNFNIDSNPIYFFLTQYLKLLIILFHPINKKIIYFNTLKLVSSYINNNIHVSQINIQTVF